MVTIGRKLNNSKNILQLKNQLGKGMKEGSFVVRTNERNNVVLSVLHNDQAYHVQTEVFHEGDQTRYRQVESFEI